MARKTDLDAAVALLQAEIDRRFHTVERFTAETDKRYEQRFLAQEKAVTAALAAAEKAVNVAEVNSEKWRNNANEWRATMGDRERSFARGDAVDDKLAALTAKGDAMYKTLDERLRINTARLDKATELNQLASRIDRRDGGDLGTAVAATVTARTTAMAIAACAVLVAVGSLIALVLK